MEAIPDAQYSDADLSITSPAAAKQTIKEMQALRLFPPNPVPTQPLPSTDAEMRERTPASEESDWGASRQNPAWAEPQAQPTPSSSKAKGKEKEMDVDEDFTLVTSKRKRGPPPEQKPLELKGLKLKEVQKRLRIDKHGNAYLLPAPEPPKQPSGSSWSRGVSAAARNPKPWTKTPSRC